MINTLMLAASLFQADLSQVKPAAVDIDREVIASQIEIELNNALTQMTQSLLQESSRLEETKAELVELNSLQGNKLTRMEQESSRL